MKKSLNLTILFATALIATGCTSKPVETNENQPTPVTTDAVETKNTTDPSVTDTRSVEEIITDAVKAMDTAKCQALKDVPNQDSCVKKVHEATEREKVESEKTDLETYRKATSSADASLCEEISDKITKAQCLENSIISKALATKDDSVCNKMETSEKAADCKVQVQIAVDSEKIDPENADNKKAQ